MHTPRPRQVHQLFSTPVGVFDVPDAASLNPVLERAILEREQAASSAIKSNRGGWHSEADMLGWGVPEINVLGDVIRSAVGHMMSATCRCERFRIKQRLVMWCNVNRRGAYNQMHNHADCHWSGAYYVRAGQYDDEPVPGSGHIEFMDPRGGVNAMHYCEGSTFGGKVRVRPTDGTLLVFPAWLYHGVNAFDSDQVRISIAFNSKVLEFASA